MFYNSYDGLFQENVELIQTGESVLSSKELILHNYNMTTEKIVLTFEKVPYFEFSLCNRVLR